MCYASYLIIDLSGMEIWASTRLCRRRLLALQQVVDGRQHDPVAALHSCQTFLDLAADHLVLSLDTLLQPPAGQHLPPILEPRHQRVEQDPNMLGHVAASRDVWRLGHRGELHR